METMVRSEPRLGRLAVEIKQEHEAAERSMRDSLTHAKVAGEKLIEVKSLLQHGEWMQWVEGHCDFSHSTAVLYMSIAREWEPVLGNSQRVANLPLREAARLLSRAVRDDQADARWDKDLHTTTVVNSVDRLLTEVRGFVESLQGGRLWLDMDKVVADKTVLDSSDLEKLRSWFVDLRKQTDKCIEVLRLRLNTVQDVRWADQALLFNSVGHKEAAKASAGGRRSVESAAF